MMEWCFWANSHHWSSYPTRRKRDEQKIVIRIAYFKSLNWFGFNFGKYHPQAVEVIKQLPTYESYFYEQVQDKYTKFRVWCIDGKHFERILAQLQQIEDIDLEFVVRSTTKGLVIPEPFQPLPLTFYERGKC